MNRTRTVLRALFTVNILFILLLAFSSLYLEPGSGASVAAVMTLIPTTLMLLIIGVLLYLDWDVLDF